MKERSPVKISLHSLSGKVIIPGGCAKEKKEATISSPCIFLIFLFSVIKSAIFLIIVFTKKRMNSIFFNFSFNVRETTNNN